MHRMMTGAFLLSRREAASMRKPAAVSTVAARKIKERVPDVEAVSADDSVGWLRRRPARLAVPSRS